MAYANLVATMSATTVEDFGRMTHNATFDIDPWSRNFVESTAGVTRDGLGRGWQKIQVFKTGIAGAAEWRSPLGNAPTTTTESTQFVIYGANAARGFPAISEHTAPSYVQASCSIKELVGSFSVPTEIIRLDMNPNNIAQQYQAILEGAATQLALRVINSIWALSTSTTDGAMFAGTKNGTTNITGAGTLTGTATVTLTATDGLTYYDCLKFQPGDKLDYWELNSTTWTNLTASTSPLFVLYSDPVALQLTLGATSGSITLTGSRGFELHARNSATGSGGSAISTYQPTSLAAVIKDSGTIYGLSTTTHPYFKSVVKAVSGPLTPTVFARYLGLATHTKAVADRIDKCVTTPGVKAEYIETLNYQASTAPQMGPNRQPISINDGFNDGMKYTYDGLSTPIEVSTFCPRGTLYGLKTRDGNWQKVMPPAIPGVGKAEGFMDGVEFTAKKTHPTIFTMTRASSTAAPTDMIEAPHKLFLEFMPRVIPGLKLTGLHETLGAYDGTA